MSNKLEESIFQGHLYFLELTFTSFRSYFQLVENNLVSHQQILKDKYYHLVRKLQEEDFDEEDLNKEYESASKALHEVEIDFIHRFRASIIIQLYSILETDLKNFCNAHSVVNFKEYSVKDLNGMNDLDKIKKYMSKSGNIKLGENKLWPFINDFRKLRNCLVHANGIIGAFDNDYSSLKKLSVNNFYLQGSDDSFVIRLNNPKFLEICINNVETFITTSLKK